MMIRAGIIGATGYVGAELVRLLSRHPGVKISGLTSKSYAGENFGDVYENFRGESALCEEEDIERLARGCDVVFLALPHGIASKKVTRDILAAAKIIDMGADFRLKSAETYEKWYEVRHESENLLAEAVYGLCEINRPLIKEARLIANPGCYTTASILALYPLLREGLIDPRSIIIDAKSGVTGAGRGATLGTHFCETSENVKAYKIAAHRHTPEIEEQLSIAAGREITLSFTPHLIPMNRGILATIYASLSEGTGHAEIESAFSKQYGAEYFVRLTKKSVVPETKWVKGSNFVDIGFVVDERTRRVVVVAALDNLMKGAAGQAVQNMNIMFGLDESAGLEAMPIFPA